MAGCPSGLVPSFAGWPSRDRGDKMPVVTQPVGLRRKALLADDPPCPRRQQGETPMILSPAILLAALAIPGAPEEPELPKVLFFGLSRRICGSVSGL